MNETDALGEVVAANTQSIDVECHRLYHTPAFGSFIRADCAGSGQLHYGVVTRAGTGPFDGNRIVQAHRLAPGELEERKPHLATLLRTSFQARLVGYGGYGAAVLGPAPVPPRLHCFVYAASPDQVRALTDAPEFLRPLLQVPDVPQEDMLLAAMAAARAAWGNDAPVVRWGKYLARLLRQDYVTLESVLRRLAAPAPPPPARSSPAWEQPLPLHGNGAAGRAGSSPPGRAGDPTDPFEDA